MIVATRVMKEGIGRFITVVDGLPLMLLESRWHQRLYGVVDEAAADVLELPQRSYWLKLPMHDYLVVMPSEHLPEVKERLEDAGIRQLKWDKIAGRSTSTTDYAYQDRAGRIHFQIGAFQERVFEPDFT